MGGWKCSSPATCFHFNKKLNQEETCFSCVFPIITCWTSKSLNISWRFILYVHKTFCCQKQTKCIMCWRLSVYNIWNITKYEVYCQLLVGNKYFKVFFLLCYKSLLNILISWKHDVNNFNNLNLHVFYITGTKCLIQYVCEKWNKL